MKKSQYKSLCALIAGIGVASVIACSEGPEEFDLEDSSIDVGETSQEAVKASPKAYPIAIGHDQIFYSDGQRKEATLANVLEAQKELTAKLLFDAGPDVQAVFEEMEAAAAPVKGAARSVEAEKVALSNAADKLDFLIAGSVDPENAVLKDMSVFFRNKTGVGPSAVSDDGAPMLKLATSNSGQAYWNECAAAGVPNPPPLASNSWVRQGAACANDNQCYGGGACVSGKCSLAPNNVGGLSEVFTYTSASPAGLCIALPRRTNKASQTFYLYGIICQGTTTSRSCFWDNKSGAAIGINEQVTIPTSAKIVGGAALATNGQGVCTSCHAGENAFIIHPRTALDVANTTAKNWVRPIVAASWPQNVGPGKELDRLGSYSATMGGQPCSACHNKASGRRFPRLEDSAGYCGVALWSYDNIMTKTNFPTQGMPPISPLSAAHRAVFANSSNCNPKAKASKFASAKTKWHDWFAPYNETPLLGDFNADGRVDIVTFVMDAGADVWVSLSTGSSFAASSVWHGNFGLPGQQVRVGDFNADGRDDIVVALMNNAGQVNVALSSGAGFGNAVNWNGHVLSGEIFLTGDFNGDRKDDIVIFTKGSTNDALVQLSNGSSFGGAALWHGNIASGSKVPLIGDVNGDGFDDVVVFAMDSTADVHVALSNGSSFGALTLWNGWFGLPGEQVDVADVNGDGLDDIITFVPGGAAYAALSTGSSFAASTIWHSNFSPSGQKPLVGDVNADHRADAVLFTKGSAGDVYVSLAQP